MIVAATRTDITSNAGFLAFGKIDRKLQMISAVSSCFTDAENLRRKSAKCEAKFKHSLKDLLAQRVFQIGLGYEDGLDANDLRRDSALKLAVGKDSALGSQPNQLVGRTKCRFHFWRGRKQLSFGEGQSIAR